MDINILIAEEFSETPGARYETDGDDSGEAFYNTILEPRFLSLKEGDSLIINLDGIFPMPPSFASESFGKLYKNYGGTSIWEKIKFISNDNPILIDTIKMYAEE